ncbi:hypothetical protein [Pontitalea aquivivens]|uniref:hypothetical protein n=1 Tax=Pontitalea aquivivens TaxID=3388663 RepID=UPI003970F990
MDILLNRAYRLGMMSRLVTLLAMLAIVVMTTVTAAHAVRMTAGAGHAMHGGETAHVLSTMPCDHDAPCGAADNTMCELACLGLTAVLIAQGVTAGHGSAGTIHDVPRDTSQVGRAPGLTERPPQFRLL